MDSFTELLKSRPDLLALQDKVKARRATMAAEAYTQLVTDFLVALFQVSVGDETMIAEIAKRVG